MAEPTGGPRGGRPGLIAWAVVVAAFLAASALWVVGDRTADSLLASAAAMAGAAAVLLIGRRRPVLAVAIVFALASASRIVLETPVGTLRLEQPAIVALVVTAAIHARRRGLRLPREVRLIAAAVLLYLVTLAVSSALVAPDPIASLRMTLWWAISAAGGGAAFVLLRGRTVAGRDAFVVVGAGFAAIGIVAAVLFGIAGSDVAPGIQEAHSVQPRVYGLGWESNLYASYVGAMLLLAVGAVGRRGGWALGAVAILGIAFPLGVTRGAYLGLAAGALSMAAIVGWRARRGGFRVPRSLITTGGLGLASLVLGVACVGLLLPNDDQRPEPGVAAASPSPPPTATAAATVPGSPGGSAAPSPAPTPTPTPTPTPEPSRSPRPTLVPAADTVGFRLARIGPALEDLRGSPLVGLGANSFGQRHADASQAGAPDHLPFLFLSVPYESGAIGVLALVFAFTLLLAGLARRSAGPSAILAASLLGAAVSILVAYEATNALHFAANWLLFGLAMAVAWDEPGSAPSPG